MTKKPTNSEREREESIFIKCCFLGIKNALGGAGRSCTARQQPALLVRAKPAFCDLTCFISGEGMKALATCCGISDSPQNALDVPAESIAFVACGGAGGSFSSSLCYPCSRAAAASRPSGVPGGCQQAGVAQGSKFCCCCSSASGPLHLKREGRGYSLPCNRNSA